MFQPRGATDRVKKLDEVFVKKKFSQLHLKKKGFVNSTLPAMKLGKENITNKILLLLQEMTPRIVAQKAHLIMVHLFP